MTNNNIKISILTSSDFPYGGASENFVREMALGIHHNIQSIEVIRFWGDRYSNDNNTSISCSNYLFKKPFKNEFYKFFELFFQILYIPLFITTRKLIKKDDIILLYGLDRAYIVFPITLLCKIFSLKCYRFITEIYPASYYVTHWWRKPIVLFNTLQIKYFDRLLNGIIVLSKYLYENCIKNGVDKKRVLLIPHFINLKNLEINHSIYIDTKKQNMFRIGYCGSLTIDNGVIDLLTSFLILEKKLSNIELVVIGFIPSNIQKIIENQNFNSSKIYFTGLLNKEDIEKELCMCSVLVNPRRKTLLADSGFPTKLGEYFASMKPVVSTLVGDLIHYFKDKNELVFAEPNNPESIVEAIEYLYNNEKEAKKIGLNGYNWASHNLDNIQNSTKLINFIYSSDNLKINDKNAL